MTSALLLLASACTAPATAPPPPAARVALDPHSFARPHEAAVRHLNLDLTVDFAARRLTGSATLDLTRTPEAKQLVLDTRDLDIHAVRLGNGEDARFALAPEQEVFGQALTVELPAGVDQVRVEYATQPGAAALQWLEPAQTAGPHPFLFTQSQAILARTWIPLQDSPGVRFTYEATVRVPPALMAVMSAENPQAKTADGVYHFKMPQPVPSYLMALAVGDLEFRPLGPRSGVYAEPTVVAGAADELNETEAMITAAEALYGPYRWGRYDLLVLPPSFPFGGMENPRLTFATPTILAGDRSLVALVAHELAHSWSGNLVTNSTWNDFWLNEGFTTYFERRIMESLRGKEYTDMLAVLGRGDLNLALADLPPADTRLRLDLAGRDPDDGASDVAYEKGALFLRHLEMAAGRERWDTFLKAYFDRHAFKTMDTTTFLAELERDLLKPAGLDAAKLEIAAWVDQPGLPASAPTVTAAAFTRVDGELARWQAGAAPGTLTTAAWTTHEWLHFLRHLPEGLTAAQMAELDQAFRFSQTGNSEILFAWLINAIRHDYHPADAALESFLTRQGRRKFVLPLFVELAKTPAGLTRAEALFAKAGPRYHSVARDSIAAALAKAGAGG